MLRNTLRFFTPTSSRQYAVNSPRHVLLQAEMGKQAAMLRKVNESLIALSTEQQKIGLLCLREVSRDSFKEPGDKELFFRMTSYALTELERKQAAYKTDKTNIMATMSGLLSYIRNECASTGQVPEIHAIEAPKAGMR